MRLFCHLLCTFIVLTISIVPIYPQSPTTNYQTEEDFKKEADSSLKVPPVTQEKIAQPKETSQLPNDAISDLPSTLPVKKKIVQPKKEALPKKLPIKKPPPIPSKSENYEKLENRLNRLDGKNGRIEKLEKDFATLKEEVSKTKIKNEPKERRIALEEGTETKRLSEEIQRLSEEIQKIRKKMDILIPILIGIVIFAICTILILSMGEKEQKKPTRKVPSRREFERDRSREERYPKTEIQKTIEPTFQEFPKPQEPTKSIPVEPPLIQKPSVESMTCVDLPEDFASRFYGNVAAGGALASSDKIILEVKEGGKYYIQKSSKGIELYPHKVTKWEGNYIISELKAMFNFNIEKFKGVDNPTIEGKDIKIKTPAICESLVNGKWKVKTKGELLL